MKDVDKITKTSKIIKDMTANARAHFDIFDKARNIYLQQIARAEADYNERLKRALVVLTGEVETTEKQQTAAE